MTHAAVESRVALILASGRGVRIGGPKAFLWWGDAPLAVAHARARRREFGRAIVVTRQDTARELAVGRWDVETVVSTMADALGPSGSIAAAVRAGALDGRTVAMVTPVDVPPAAVAVVDALLAAIAGGERAARPTLDGIAGHPVVCSATVLLEAYASGEPRPLREVLRDGSVRCVDVPVTDPDVLLDFDTPSAYEQRTGSRPAFWRNGICC